MILIRMIELDFLLLGDKDKKEGRGGKGEERKTVGRDIQRLSRATV